MSTIVPRLRSPDVDLVHELGSGLIHLDVDHFPSAFNHGVHVRS
jgi:hypothetical protein